MSITKVEIKALDAILNIGLDGLLSDANELKVHLIITESEIEVASDLIDRLQRNEIQLHALSPHIQSPRQYLVFRWLKSVKLASNMRNEFQKCNTPSDSFAKAAGAFLAQQYLTKVVGGGLGLQLSTNTKLEQVIDLHMKKKSQIGKTAADARHDAPGGAREKQAAIKEIWDSGKYSSRDICAEQECAALGMSFSTARKALRKTPNSSNPEGKKCELYLSAYC
jgi:hypothetical protein